MTRPSALADGDYDAVVIGGGMAGAGVARDLALRGVSVALVEKDDFAAATTSRSSKLIHGGLRYLELFDVGLVRESLRERETLNRLAPHLVRPLPFLVPIYRHSSRGLIKVRIGLTLYDWLTPGRDRERYRVLPPIDTLSLEPAIRAEDLRGAGYYFDDLLVFPERLCLENVLSACRHGARAFNYAQVEEIVRAPGGAPAGVRVRDLDRLHATRDEVSYLLGEVRRALPDPRVAFERVVYTYAGVRPLSYEEGKRESDVSRAHKVVTEAGGRFLSITGTKLTCFRSLAAGLGDAVMRTLGRRAPARTDRFTLDGLDEEAGRVEARTWLDVSAEVASSGLGRETLVITLTLYWPAYPTVVDLAAEVPSGTDQLCPQNPDIVAH